MERTLDRATNDALSMLHALDSEDELACYWSAQVNLRLRREIRWLWRNGSDPSTATHYEFDKRAFFAEDPAVCALEAELLKPPPHVRPRRRGSFSWLVEELELEPVESFVLALALLPAVDSAAAEAIAICQSSAARNAPTLSLAQRLWDRPDEILPCLDPVHPFPSYGLLVPGDSGFDWRTPLLVPPPVAHELLFGGEELPPSLRVVMPAPLPHGLHESAVTRVASALWNDDEQSVRSAMRVIPVIGNAAAPLAEVAAGCIRKAGALMVRPPASLPRESLSTALTLAWLVGHPVFLPASMLQSSAGVDARLQPPPLRGLPICVFVGVTDASAARDLGPTHPAVVVPPLTYAERLSKWRRALPGSEALAPELARRFRFDAPAIARVGRDVAALDRPLRSSDVFAAARSDLEVGTLAQPVIPRFARADLMLPQLQSTQIDEIIAAMRHLARVHHEWGTARAWNESGLAVLFAGPPGTGKTMAAEVLAAELDLPLYRIDLSQVVNKYIGETEKNLRLLFDAADSADVILFFDEADALFGKRSEVKDAHDRYANLEISYLLERMERFKSMAILGTNRRRDLDEAFIRRLRFVVEFPLPALAERLRIWQNAFPAEVDVSGVDIEFLAQRFPLAGGHIRSIVFHACLQTAAPGASVRLDMPAVIRAVHREYQKLDRATSLEQFGPYAGLIAEQEADR